ncbi:MAG: hypothetical protein NVS1B4_09780 [Gemmatimonadaceae bacterium]
MTASVQPLRRFKFAPVLAGTVVTVLGLWLVGRAASVFLLLFLAILISLALSALAEWYQPRLHLPRAAAFALAILSALGAVVGLGALLIPPIVAQTQQLIKVLPDYISGWEAAADRLVLKVPALREVWQPGEHRLMRAAYDQISGQFQNLVPKVFSVIEALISVFSVLVMAIYLALEPEGYREYLIALFPPLHRDLVRDVLSDVATQLRAYIVGQLFTMTALGVLTAGFLALLHVPYALTFGVFTGAVAVVPFFGSLLSTLLPALFVLSEPSGGSRALAVVGVGVVIHLLEGNILSPYFMRTKAKLPPILTIISVLIMGRLIGGVGLVVAVPMLAMLLVIVRRILLNRIYEGQGFRRERRDRTLVLRVPAAENAVLLPEGPTLDVISIAERELLRRGA